MVLILLVVVVVVLVVVGEQHAEGLIQLQVQSYLVQVHAVMLLVGLLSPSISLSVNWAGRLGCDGVEQTFASLFSFLSFSLPHCSQYHGVHTLSHRQETDTSSLLLRSR